MASKMYFVHAGAGLGVPGVEWVNGPPMTSLGREIPHGHIPDRGNKARGVGSGFWPMETPPLHIIDRLKGRPPADIEPWVREIWLVSDRAKQVLEAIDPEAFEFLKVDTRIKRGETLAPGPSYWWCDVIRYLDALDEEKSNADVRTYADGTRLAQRKLIGGEVLKSAVIGHGNKIFRLFYAPRSIYATEAFAKAVKEAKLTGITLSDGGRLDA